MGKKEINKANIYDIRTAPNVEEIYELEASCINDKSKQWEV